MPDQIIPIRELDKAGIILDTPAVSLPPNVFTDARNVRFKDGAVRKMEGEVDIFPDLSNFLNDSEVGDIQYFAWWPNPNQTTLDRGYYITVVEHTVAGQEVEHFIYAFLPNSSTVYNIGRYTSTDIITAQGIASSTTTITITDSEATTLNNLKNNLSVQYAIRVQVDNTILNISDIIIDTDGNTLTLTEQGVAINWPTGNLTISERRFTGYSRQGNWQHTLFNGGFSFIINNGVDKPLYITDPSGNVDIRRIELNDLPGWDSYEVNAIVLRDIFDAAVNSRVFDTGQLRVEGVSDYIVTVIDTDGTESVLQEDTDIAVTLDSDRYRVTIDNGQNVITLGTGAIQTGQTLQVNFRSLTPVGVRASVVRAFGDFLVAGNLVEYALDNLGNIIDDSIVRRLTGVVRSSDVASPGAIPNNWDPFAVGVSTADEFVIADTGIVQDMVALQGNLYLYTNTSISVMRLTGNATTPLSVQPVTDQYGALTTDSVLEYDGKHFVIGSDDVYLFGGHPGSIQSISDGKVRRTFFNRINPINENINNLFTLRYAARDEIWICFPTVNSVRGECDEAYIWNYRTGAWTIRTLNSVVSGDIGPVPGGGVPSAIMTFSGSSGTDDIIQLGSREIQTFNVAPTATVGHAENSMSEVQLFRTLDSVQSGGVAVPRPALVLDAAELIEVTIDSDFFSGPNPNKQTYDLVGLTGFTVGAFVNGGASLRLSYIAAGDGTLPAPTGSQANFTIAANQLGLTDGTVTKAEFINALVTHINNDNVLELSDWTASVSDTDLRITSDVVGVRQLTSPTFTIFTTQANRVVTDVAANPDGPYSDSERIFVDNFGDELFTVTRTDSDGTYTYRVTTMRSTGFQVADQIYQLAFTSGGQTFTAPTPFDSDSIFSFVTNDSEYDIVKTPEANFINLITSSESIAEGSSGNSGGVTLSRSSISGGFLHQGVGSDTTENVAVQVTGTTPVNFIVTNNNPFSIAFSYQNGAQSATVAANGSSTFLGTLGDTDMGWAWITNTISLSGTAIGGSGATDLRGNSGRQSTTGSGVTVVTQNTSTPQSTTSSTARDQAVLLPANNGGSITNAATATYNPSTNFQTVDWTGGSQSQHLGAYRLSNGSRVTGGTFSRFPSGWSTGFDEGYFPQTPTISATNITSPAGMGSTSFVTQRGVMNCGDDGCFCIALQNTNARSSNWGGTWGYGIRQSGSATNSGPAVGVQKKRGRNGFGWTVDSTGRSNECGGNFNSGSSFSEQARVFCHPTTRATGVRIILYGPLVTNVVVVPRVSSETHTVTNTNPFPIIYTVSGTSYSVGADTERTISFGSEGNAWSVSSTTNTAYQFTVTNNNIRDLISGTLTHGGFTTDLAGLAPGASAFSDFSGNDTASVSFVRAILQSGGVTTLVPTSLNLILSGVGPYDTDQSPVAYNFGVDFISDTDSDISITYNTPVNNDPNDTDNFTNIEAAQAFKATLSADSDFNTYFELKALDLNGDPLDSDTFRISARAAPGDLIPGTTIRMPAHNAVTIGTPVNNRFGGNAALSVRSIQRAQNSSNDDISITLNTGTRVLQPDGTLSDSDDFTKHTFIIGGTFDTDDAGRRKLNEVFRNQFNSHVPLKNLWDVTDSDTENPTNFQLTSDNNGPHFVRVTEVNPASSGLLPEHFEFARQRSGTLTPLVPIYPQINVQTPLLAIGHDTFKISLEPFASDSSTDRLTYLEIANFIRSRFAYTGWRVFGPGDSDSDDFRIGNGVGGAKIKLVRDSDGSVNGMWSVLSIDYGNTGTTLVGDSEVSDGNTIGRLNVSDFFLDTDAPSNTDYRARKEERSQPTRVMIAISNQNEQGTRYGLVNGVVTNLGFANVQYIPLILGDAGNYNPRTQTGTQPGTRQTAENIVNAIESEIIVHNNRVQVSSNPRVGEITVLPTQYSEIANFVLDVVINNSLANVQLWNAIVTDSVNINQDLIDPDLAIDTENNMGVQSTVPSSVVSGNGTQFEGDTDRIPSFDRREVVTDTVTFTSNIDTQFDPLRPWPTSQVNLNKEYPIFANSELQEDNSLTKSYRGADLGFVYNNIPYESYVTRTDLALTPEFNTEQVQSLALWADGGTPAQLGGNLTRATLQVNTYGSDAPGAQANGYGSTNPTQRSDEFIIGQDYKVDMRTQGRFININITDNLASNPDDNGARVAWNLSGLQATVTKGGTR